MRRTLASLTAAALLALAASTSFAQTSKSLTIGDPAPAPNFGAWIKGEPVTKFEPGTVYIIECWATWCGPCKAAIPHVTELQKKYEGKVVVIGVDVWEQDESKVAPFVTEMGDKMGYRVVMDNKTTAPKGEVATNWLDAAGQNGIPCSFIINKEGKIAYIGHPMAMDKPLEQILAGTYDMAKATEELNKKTAETKVMMEAQQSITAAMRTGDPDKFIAAVDEAAAKSEAIAAQADLLKFQTLLLRMKKPEVAYKIAEDALAAGRANDRTFAMLGMMITSAPGLSDRNYGLAVKCLTKACEMTENKEGTYLNALAAAHFGKGNVDDAISYQKLAIERATEKLKPTYEAKLAEYTAAKAAPAK